MSNISDSKNVIYDKSSNNDEIFDEIHTTTMPTSPNGVTHRMEQHEGQIKKAIDDHR